jgi:hypothetical protein
MMKKSIKLTDLKIVYLGEPVEFSCPPYEPAPPNPKEEGV